MWWMMESLIDEADGGEVFPIRRETAARGAGRRRAGSRGGV